MSDRSDSPDDKNLAQTILGLGEERLGSLVSELLGNEGFVKAMQQAVTSSLTAKRSVDKGVATLLGLANIPTLDDVDKVRERMVELEESMGEILERLEALSTSLDAGSTKKSKKR